MNHDCSLRESNEAVIALFTEIFGESVCYLSTIRLFVVLVRCHWIPRASFSINHVDHFLVEDKALRCVVCALKENELNFFVELLPKGSHLPFQKFGVGAIAMEASDSQLIRHNRRNSNKYS